jgi:hypothetical protein
MLFLCWALLAFSFFVCPLLPLLSMHGVLHCGFGMIAGEDIHSCTLKVVICVKEGNHRCVLVWTINMEECVGL